MKRQLLLALFGLLLLGLTPSAGQFPDFPGGVPFPVDPSEKRYEDFEKVVKGARKYEGLFTLHHKEDRIYLEIRPEQFERPFLCPMAIARGSGMGGHTLNFDEQWVLMFHRVGDKVHLVRRNIRYTAKPNTPEAKAVETTYTDSVLLALRIQAMNIGRQSVLVNLNDVFLQNFAELPFGMMDPSRSHWLKVKVFPRNIELQVAATFSGSSHGILGMLGGRDAVIDSRGNTVVLHYGMVQLPEFGYQPRLADDRVGHFLSVVKDFSSDNKDSAFVRHITRWRLERAEPVDPKNPNRLSPPKKKIVYWIEKSVPDEYRAYVREGILEWNKAFEKVGFRDAIEVRQQQDEEFDPEDINYNTFRWITSGEAFAMGPIRANPLTGEILDADIIFDADMVRFWKQEQHVYTGGKPASLLDVASPIQAYHHGWGLLDHRLLPREEGWNDLPQRLRESDEEALKARLWAIRQGICQCAAHRKYELGLAAMALAARNVIKPGERLPDELVGQAIKEVVMHEVGHTLGLRHNFKGSTMLKNEQLHDTSITRKQGLIGSVMDYTPINLAPKGVKQGDYFTSTLGPYDYWAIEYAYKPLSGGTEGEVAELQKIAARGTQAGLDFGTDEDTMTADPLINRFDLGADPMKFGQDRILLAEEMLKDLAERVVEKGEGYQRVRTGFTMLLHQYGDAAFLVSRFVGGEHIYRDHRGDDQGRDPFVPVPPAKQREALKFLEEHLLTDQPFQFSPRLLRQLGADRWYHWGNEGNVTGGVDFPVYERVLGIQRIVLNRLLGNQTLARIETNALKCEKGQNPLTLAEVFRGLTTSIWSDLDSKEAKDGKRTLASSIIRRNLQREHLKKLATMVLGESRRGGSFEDLFIIIGGGRTGLPPDARSLARLHLRELGKRVEVVLNDKQTALDDTTRAHLEECQERITKVLSASVQVNEP
jgi:hypothetical protein